MTDPATISVAAPRVSALLDVLSMIAVGELDTQSIAAKLPPVDDAFGEVETMLRTLAADLGEVLDANEQYTQQIETTARELQTKLDTIERQQLAIADLSTPVLEIWTDVLALPIVGIVDTQRSVEMTERLLQTIVDRQARCAIIDITGVDVVDTATADHFVKMVRAAAMLGAHCVVCGISPDVAQTLARIDVELTDVITKRSLKDALHHCLAHIANLDRARGARRPLHAVPAQEPEA
ncbi:MAG: STAS domain-containing protein [Myxococcota bacterium]